MNALTINEEEDNLPKRLISIAKSQLLVYQVLIQFYFNQFGKNAREQIFINEIKVKFDSFFGNYSSIFSYA